MKKILITAGGTTEYIDDVRVLTNISTGKLGLQLAASLKPNSPTLLIPKNLHTPINATTVSVTDVSSVMLKMKELVPQHDIIVHAMAVSDFGFNRANAVKLKSNDLEAFIEHMRKNIRMNPKVISHIKEWNPNCHLIGFKFEVGLTHEELLHSAITSFLKNRCDLVIANDKEEMVRENSHIAYLIAPAETEHPHFKVLKRIAFDLPEKDRIVKQYTYPQTGQNFLYIKAISKDDLVWHLNRYITNV